MDRRLPRVRADEQDLLKAALEDYASAQEAWLAARRAAERAEPGSRAASVTREAARHAYQMARGRLLLEQGSAARRAGEAAADEKAWGGH